MPKRQPSYLRGYGHGALRVLITGGRDYQDRDAVFRALDRIQRKHGVSCLISGHCTVRGPTTGEWVLSGADRWGEEWAREHGVPVMPFPVTPGGWKAFGKAAGPLRNERMTREGCPDLGVHFPGGAGTADCCARLFERGVLRWNPLTNEVT